MSLTSKLLKVEGEHQDLDIAISKSEDDETLWTQQAEL